LVAVGEVLSMGAQPVILLVEDDPDDALFVRVGLLGTRPEVRLVVLEDGMEAMNYLQGKAPYSERVLFPQPNLILLDLKLPTMSGLHILRWIRQQQDLKEVPVVVLTGSLDEMDQQTSFEMGASAYILKPFGLEKMRSVVKDITERWLSPGSKTAQPTSDWAGTERKAA
jgi:CheY-like chemotaxis protein